jgi:hypothetical protein
MSEESCLIAVMPLEQRSLSPERTQPPVLDLSRLSPDRRDSLDPNRKISSTKELLNTILGNAKATPALDSRKNSRRNSRQNSSRSPEKQTTSLSVRAAEARKKLGNTSNRSFLGDNLKTTKDKKKDAETNRSQSRESRRASLSVVEEPLQIIDVIRKKALTQKRSQSELIRSQVQEFTKTILTSEKEEVEGVVGHAETMVSLLKEQPRDSFCRSLGQQLVSQVSLLLKRPDAVLSSTVKSRLGALVSSIKAAEGLSETKEEQKAESAEAELREAVGKLTIKRLTVRYR